MMRKRWLGLVVALTMFLGIIVITPIRGNAVASGAGSKVISGGMRDFKWPVPGNYKLSGCFMEVRGGNIVYHYALDIPANKGTSVVASYTGTVIQAVDGGVNYYGDGFGNYVVVQHSYVLRGGNRITLYTRYSHLNSVSVTVGDTVTGGVTEVGKVGSSGQSTGPHLDFQILQNGWTTRQKNSLDPFINELLEMPIGIKPGCSNTCAGVGPTACCCYLYIQDAKAVYAKNLDNESPAISNVSITNLNSSGYTITCTVTDNIAVDRVQFPSWSDNNGQDDLFYDWVNSQACRGTQNGNTFTYHVSIADHNNDHGKYFTHIYAYDTAGNSSVYHVNDIMVPEEDIFQLTYYNSSGQVWLTETATGETTHTLSTGYPKKSGSYFCGWSFAEGASDYSVRPSGTVWVTGDIKLYPVYVTHEKAVSGEMVFIYNINDFTVSGYNVKEEESSIPHYIDNSYWTEWSGYSTEPVAASDKVQVRTTPMYRYYYYLCPSCGAHEPFYGRSDCGANIPTTAAHVGWFTTPYSQCGHQRFSYTTAKYYTTSLGDGQLWIFSAGNLNDTAIGTTDYGNAGEVIVTGYSSRKYVEQISTTYETRTGYIITPKTYTVSYNANGGSDAPSAQTKTYGVTIKLSGIEPQRQGYTFLGWSTSSTATSATYAPNGNFTVNANTTLYAVWKKEPLNTDGSIKAYVERLYTKLLGREAEISGLNWWAEELREGRYTAAHAAASFIFGPEFVGQNNSDEVFLDRLYATFFDRAADPSGKEYWLNYLQGGVTREYVAAQFVNSAEFETVCAEYGMQRGSIGLSGYVNFNPNLTMYVVRCYREIHGRDADPSGLEFWCEMIATKQRDATLVAKSFVDSTEFIEKNLSNEEYIKVLYRAFMGRESDPSGLAYWIGRLEDGTPRLVALDEFANCQEFWDILRSFGL